MTTMGATPVTAIACPSWCSVSQSTHLRELRWEGRALHWSDARSGDGWEIRHTSATDAGGRALEVEPVFRPVADDAPGRVAEAASRGMVHGVHHPCRQLGARRALTGVQ